MRLRASEFLGSQYVRAVAALSGGQLFVTVLPILAAPILGRLSLPEHYGALGTYLAVSGMLGVVSTLQFQHGIIAETSEQRAEGLVRLCLLSAAATAFAAAFLALGMFTWMGSVSAYIDVRAWVLLLPVSTLAAGLTSAILALANRRQRYGAMARLPMYSVVATVATSIGLGLLGWGAHGLFASYFFGQLIGVAIVLRLYRSLAGTSARLSLRHLIALGWRHRRFALYTLPSEFVGTINQQLPVYALTAVGAASLLGLFIRARQLVAMPLTLLGGAIAQVFRQRAAQQYRETGSCRPIYHQTALALAALGLPPMLVFMVFAPDLFWVFLGPNWTDAGEVARILAPMLLMRVIVSPLTTVFYFTGNQALDLKLMIMSAVIVALSISLGWTLIGTAYAVVWAFSIGYSVVYLIYGYFSWAIT